VTALAEGQRGGEPADSAADNDDLHRTHSQSSGLNPLTPVTNRCMPVTAV
jgi:hypothetical protein